ncbi:hypothetical protein CHS0354_038944 [Potamilus streckersoni]|uniref:Uncharacterized protein n=1 Tax=Potamilus streckersoni TaxID=2493646 RepID=A0AAE0VM52_9BIVA|nr:hypothetical protein CHS0354_038944 [Potamilus streckersoni]
MTGRLTILTLCLVAVAVMVQSQKCGEQVKQCSCSVPTNVEQIQADTDSAVTKSEGLAAAVGALSPLLVGGVGMGIWKIMQMRKSGSANFSRTPSNLSDDSINNTQRARSQDKRRGTMASLTDYEEDHGYDSPRRGSDADLIPGGKQPPPSKLGNPLSQANNRGKDNLNAWLH